MQLCDGKLYCGYFADAADAAAAGAAAVATGAVAAADDDVAVAASNYLFYVMQAAHML